MRYYLSACLLLLTVFSFAQVAPASEAASSYTPPPEQETGRYSQDYIDNVGGKLSVGITFGDGFGIPVRYYWTPNNVVEAGMYLGTSVVLQEDGSDEYELYFPSGPTFGLAYTRLGNKFEKVKKRKSKIRALGVTPRFVHQFSAGPDNSFTATRFSVGFTQETYKGPNHNRNYVFEIGPYYRYMNGKFDGVDFTGADYGIYLRFNWNWFLE